MKQEAQPHEFFLCTDHGDFERIARGPYSAAGDRGYGRRREPFVAGSEDPYALPIEHLLLNQRYAARDLKVHM